MNNIVKTFQIFLLISCADGTNFLGKTKNAKPSPTESGSDTVSGKINDPPKKASKKNSKDENSDTEVFYLEKNTTKLDVIWIIDHSGSMENEIAQVEANFDSFIASLQATSEVHVSVLGQGCQPTAFGVFDCHGQPFKLSPEAQARGHSHHKVRVSSRNSLAILGAALCPADLSAPNCQKAAEETDFLLDPSNPRFLNDSFNPGFLNGNFRKNSAKVVVIVTDDNADDFPADDLNVIIDNLDIENLTYFSFQGLPESSCDVINIGTEYQTLAQQTGGKAFDICKTDWSSSFSQLTSSIKEIVKSRFELTKDYSYIESIEVDGKLLERHKYKKIGQRSVKLSDSVVTNAKKVVIKYIQAEAD